MFFNANGVVIDGYRGNESEVLFPSKLRTMYPYAIVTHTHPMGKSGFGGTFAIEDVIIMSRSNWREFRIAAHGQGEMNYIIRRTEASNGKGLRKQVKRDKKDLTQRYKGKYRREYRRLTKNGVPSAQARHVARQKASGVMDRYFKTVLPQYGFEYIKRKDPYNYGR